MTFKANVLLVALLALCLAVPAVNAANYVVNVDVTNQNAYTVDLGTISESSTVEIVLQGWINSGLEFDYTYNGNNYAFSQKVYQSSTIIYTTIATNSGNSIVITVNGYRVGVGAQVFAKSVSINYNYPEPTPVPSPYISVTELYSDNLGTVYRLQCMPDDERIFYSGIVPYLIPPYEGGDYGLTSAETVVEYRVPAGGTSVFSSRYVTYPMTFGVISTTITAPPLTPEQNQTYNPIPDPAQKPLTPFTSGKFQPTLTSGQVDVISKSPYLALLSNLNQTMQLPIMESPESIRNKLVPDDLENITGPLYDTAAGWAEFTNFIPRLIADTFVGVFSPFQSAIADCKTVLLSFTGQLAELMKPIYILSPVFYLFIPDLVWIGVCLVLVLLIIHALLVFVLGEDTVVYFMGRDTIVADAIPDFPALEK